MLPEVKNLLLEEEDGVLTIWLNRPEVRNALSQELIDDLVNTITAVRHQKGIRIVILRGKGGVFCAGGDLKMFKSIFQVDEGQGGADRDDIAGFNASMGPLINAVKELPQLLIVLIEGAAMAGGLGISCLADVVVTTEDALFSLTEVTLGLPPAQIAPLVIKRVGMSEGRRLMLTAARFKGAEAYRLGFAHFVVSNSQALQEKARELVNQSLRGAPGAIAKTKEIVAATERLEGDDMVQFAAYAFADAMLGSEAREGLSAFTEKRKPSWAVN